MKPLSVAAYKRSFRRFCKYAGVTPDQFPEIGLERIEDLMTDFISDNRGKLAPKYLNVIFSAVKRWCQIQGLIKSTKMFREIKFDKSSRKVDALREPMIETKHLKKLFKIANLEDSVDIGLYGLVGLRPRIIPQLEVKDIYRKNYEIVDGRIRLTAKPTLMVIPRTYTGNKANITFLVFIPTKLAELTEMLLNTNGKVTPETKISKSDNVRDVYYKMKTLLRHPAIGFNGRPYLLRKYADSILDRITRIYNDEDFKEFLMGHKGKISAVYQVTGLTKEKERELRDMYAKACDKWISENIFETVSQEESDKSEMLIAYSEQIVDIDKRKIEALRQTFQKGRLTLEALQNELGKLTRQTLDSKMEQKFEQLFLKMNAKYNH